MLAPRDVLAELGITNPVLAAPMAGGPSTPELVAAAAGAGSLGFLAGGYRTVQQLEEQITTTRRRTQRFGVNLFVPAPHRIDPTDYRRYRAALAGDAARYDADLPAEPIEDDDHWAPKVALLLEDPVPVVSFTFAVPAADVIKRLREVGTLTVQTVTSAAEAELALAAGIDLLAVQAVTAGGHYGTFTPTRRSHPLPLSDLVTAVRHRVPLPVIGAGGVTSAPDVSTTLRAGAVAVAVGTALLRSPESGASDLHKAALVDAVRAPTVVTRAFTGRPARALANAFIAEHGREAPYGYPAVHHLTAPLRRAATAAGDPELVNLWAGSGHARASADPAGVILDRLAAG